MILLSGVLYGIRNVQAIRSVKGEGSQNEQDALYREAHDQ
jgi:hypothetical protein